MAANTPFAASSGHVCISAPPSGPLRPGSDDQKAVVTIIRNTVDSETQV